LESDKSQNISLPANIECYSIAGSIGKAADSLSSQLMGDNLVGIKSALGLHKNPNKNLKFKKENTYIAYENTHLDLLSNPKIYNKIKEWLLF